MTYNGSEETYWCQMPELDVTGASGNLAAFVLTAAQKLLVGEQKLLMTAAAINRGLCYIACPILLILTLF